MRMLKEDTSPLARTNVAIAEAYASVGNVGIGGAD